MWANKGSASSASFSDIEFRELFWWVEAKGGRGGGVRWLQYNRSQQEDQTEPSHWAAQWWTTATGLSQQQGAAGLQNKALYR